MHLLEEADVRNAMTLKEIIEKENVDILETGRNLRDYFEDTHELIPKDVYQIDSTQGKDSRAFGILGFIFNYGNGNVELHDCIFYGPTNKVNDIKMSLDETTRFREVRIKWKPGTFPNI